MAHAQRVDDGAVLVDRVLDVGGTQALFDDLVGHPAAHREQQVLPGPVGRLDGGLEEPVLTGHDGSDDVEVARAHEAHEVGDEDDVDGHAVLTLLDDAVGSVGVRHRDGVAGIGRVGVEHEAQVAGAQGRRADGQEANALEER